MQCQYLLICLVSAMLLLGLTPTDASSDHSGHALITSKFGSQVSTLFTALALNQQMFCCWHGCYRQIGIQCCRQLLSKALYSLAATSCVESAICYGILQDCFRLAMQGCRIMRHSCGTLAYCTICWWCTPLFRP